MIIALGAGGMAEAFDCLSIPKTECDVTNPANVLETLGRYEPSVMIYTAGVSNPGPIGTAPFAEEINVNLFGAFNAAWACVRLGIPKMIFIASVAGLHGKPNHASYSASKAGVISLVQSLAMEGHQAYAISPGRVNTPMREKDYPSDTPGSRLEPERIWQVVQSILHGDYAPGENIIIRKVGLEDSGIVEQVAETPWRTLLKVGVPSTI